MTAELPGKRVQAVLEQAGMSQAELARRSGRPLKTINEIVQGKAAITPETALQFERVLGVPASEWMTLEARYREQRARSEERDRLAMQTAWLKRFPIRDLVKLGLISEGPDSGQTVESVLRFFGVGSPAAWDEYWGKLGAAFRRSTKYSTEPMALASWLRIGELAARELHCERFDLATFRQNLATIRGLVIEAPQRFRDPLVSLCANSGVALVFVPELSGTHVFGATRWLSPDKALIELSGRYRSDDQFWFTFFHDAGHLVLHGKRGAFIDLSDGEAESEGMEAEADQFARDSLFPPSADEGLFAQGAPTTLEIIDAAQKLRVSPGLLVGRLQRDGQLPWNRGNELKTRFEFVRS